MLTELECRSAYASAVQCDQQLFMETCMGWVLDNTDYFPVAYVVQVMSPEGERTS